MKATIGKFDRFFTMGAFRVFLGLGLIILQSYTVHIVFNNLGPRMMPDDFWSLVCIVVPIVGVNLGQFVQHLYSRGYERGASSPVSWMHYVTAAWVMFAIAYVLHWVAFTYIHGSSLTITQVRAVIAAIECVTGGAMPVMTAFAYWRPQG